MSTYSNSLAFRETLPYNIKEHFVLMLHVDALYALYALYAHIRE